MKFTVPASNLLVLYRCAALPVPFISYLSQLFVMNINGIWKGEYITQWFAFRTGKEVAVPFVMKIQAIGEDQFVGIDKGLFEGICQDDPDISKITFHATVSGSLSMNHLFFIKQYPKLLVRNTSGEIETHDGLHPEIIYKGEFGKDQFSGSWYMNRTFRKINGQLGELMPMNGSWWMRKF
jgi:hypothetical protein